VDDPRTEVQDWLFEELASRLAKVFEMMAGERLAVDWKATESPPAEDGLRWRQPFTGIPGALWITAAEPDWNAAGAHVLHAAGIDEKDAEILKSTYLEMLSQGFANLAQAMGRRLRREVTCAGGDEATAFPGEVSWASVHLKLGETTANLAIGIEAELCAVLVAALAAPPALEAGVDASPAAVPAPAKSKTYELLLDVELPVSVSFGRAQVLLKDVLKLTTGSIIELNRSIVEPVEVIVNNCVIARGEVVVVEGNFGVRIQHVISQQERLRTLN
jgi:flagellar motor switch protein FliN/FliY